MCRCTLAPATNWNGRNYAYTYDPDTMTYAGTGQDELIQQNAGSGNDDIYIYGHSDQSGTPTLESSSDVGGNTYITDNYAAGEPIDIRAVGIGIDLYYAYDGLGRLGAEISDSSGTVATFATGQWDPYGAGSLQLGGSAATKKTASTFSSKAGMTASAASSSESPWTTQGIQSYADSQCYKRGARWNDTTTGTWSSVDPITKLNGPNTYAYDDPANMMDPNGQDSFWDYLSSCAKGAATGTIIGISRSRRIRSRHHRRGRIRLRSRRW